MECFQVDGWKEHKKASNLDIFANFLRNYWRRSESAKLAKMLTRVNTICHLIFYLIFLKKLQFRIKLAKNKNCIPRQPQLVVVVQEKPHKCHTCHKSFPTPGDLKSHAYIHSGTWPFQCPVCQRGFSKQTNLRNHLFLHTGKKPHTCQRCGNQIMEISAISTCKLTTDYLGIFLGKCFALACNLRAHQRTHSRPDAVVPQVVPQSPAQFVWHNLHHHHHLAANIFNHRIAPLLCNLQIKQ